MFLAFLWILCLCDMDTTHIEKFWHDKASALLDLITLLAQKCNRHHCPIAKRRLVIPQVEESLILNGLGLLYWLDLFLDGYMTYINSAQWGYFDDVKFCVK